MQDDTTDPTERCGECDHSASVHLDSEFYCQKEGCDCRLFSFAEVEEVDAVETDIAESLVSRVETLEHVFSGAAVAESVHATDMRASVRPASGNGRGKEPILGEGTLIWALISLAVLFVVVAFLLMLMLSVARGGWAIVSAILSTALLTGALWAALAARKRAEARQGATSYAEVRFGGPPLWDGGPPTHNPLEPRMVEVKPLAAGCAGMVAGMAGFLLPFVWIMALVVVFA